jgi:hypothetical protein
MDETEITGILTGFLKTYWLSHQSSRNR